LKSLTKSLFFLCRILSPGSPAEAMAKLRREIVGGNADWERVLFIAAEYLVTPALWKALEIKGLTDLLPNDLSTFVSEVHRLNTERNKRVREQALELVRELNLLRIEPIVLKGGAGLFISPLGDTGSRVMVDVDVMVKLEDREKALQAFFRIGYSPFEYPFHPPEPCRHHFSPLVRSGEPASVELHFKLENSIEDLVINTAQVWGDSRVIEVDGVVLRILSPYHFVVHEVIHSQVNEGGFHLGVIDLRHLQDLSSAWVGLVELVDWQRALSTFEKHGMKEIFLSYLLIAHRLFGISIPDGLHPTFRTFAHYTRCLLQLHLPNTIATRIVLQAICDFSSVHLKRRFACANTFRDLTKCRWRLFKDLWTRYIVQKQELSLFHLPLAGNVSHKKMFSRDQKKFDGS
jgi:Uncharacterised nucleotidyltransferase